MAYGTDLKKTETKLKKELVDSKSSNEKLAKENNKLEAMINRLEDAELTLKSLKNLQGQNVDLILDQVKQNERLLFNLEVSESSILSFDSYSCLKLLCLI